MNNNYNVDSGCLDWDDQLNDGGYSTYRLLDGDYPFEVIQMRRGRTTGAGKLPASNKAMLVLRVEPEPGVQVDVKCDLILHCKVEWKIAAFFRCIGLAKAGEKVTMDWNSVTGARGYGHFQAKTYIGNDGKEHKANECDRFYDYSNYSAAQEQAKPVDDSFATVDDDEEMPF